jgi:transposase
MESFRTEAVGTVSASGTVVPESKRRRRSVTERRRVVEQTLAPGASVARVARDHGVNANQVFHWRRLYQRGLLGGKVQPAGGLLPVKVSESGETTAMVARGSGVTAAIAPKAASAIQIELAKGRVRIEGKADIEMLRVVLECLAR